MESINRDQEQGIARILDKDQAKRLGEIELQREGIFAVARAPIAKKLKLTSDQTTKVKTIIDEMRKAQFAAMPPTSCWVSVVPAAALQAVVSRVAALPVKVVSRVVALPAAAYPERVVSRAVALPVKVVSRAVALPAAVLPVKVDSRAEAPRDRAVFRVVANRDKEVSRAVVLRAVVLQDSTWRSSVPGSRR